jgi:2-polyprenyl-3-methyl-5-hydroxy-6-metoxy-1,4-benzoquinol methylase
VIIPTTIRLCEPGLSGGTILDAGCGSGSLTQVLAASAAHVVGVDPSEAAIAIANAAPKSGPVEYRLQTIEDFCASCDLAFSLVVANMVLMDCLDLDRVLASIATVTRSGSALVCTITHPCFWPTYWGYDVAPWFNYLDEITVEAPFRITGEQTDLPSTHVHRPLQRYLLSLSAAGYTVEQLLEPVPAGSTTTKPWPFPRYLGIRAIRV